MGIKDLVNKLMEEATAETEAKGFCDAELAKNKQTRESRTEDVNQLNTEIEDLTADLAQGVKELDQAVAEQTEERTASKAKNTQAVKEAKEAQTAVEAATAVMKDFYAKAAKATAFARAQQSPGDDAPETFDKPYQGMGQAQVAISWTSWRSSSRTLHAWSLRRRHQRRLSRMSTKSLCS